MSQPGFTVDIYQNEYLPEGGQDVSAIVTVTSPDTPLATPATISGAEIIIVDCSGSMGAPETKIAEARMATSAAVDAISDGVAFAVIAGTEEALPVFPDDGSLAVADAQTRLQAKQAVAWLRPAGGTAIGQWLRLAHETFTSQPAALRHAILLTDGKNQHETRRLLARVVDVVDAATGTVRLKKKVEDADEMALDTRSTRTVRTRK
jgi:Mg-chelatase subunit ChlD